MFVKQLVLSVCPAMQFVLSIKKVLLFAKPFVLFVRQFFLSDLHVIQFVLSVCWHSVAMFVGMVRGDIYIH